MNINSDSPSRIQNYSPIRRMEDLEVNDDYSENSDYDLPKNKIVKLLCMNICFLHLLGLLFNVDIVTEISPPFKEFYFMTISLYPDCIDLRPQIWRIFTSTLCHYGFAHLLSNILGLYVVGNFIERKINYKILLTMYLIGAFYGCLMSSIQNSYSILIGCSGPVYSCIGCFFGYKYINYKYNSNKSNLHGLLFFVIFTLMEYLTFIYSYNSSIAYYTHWTSIFGGFFYTLFLVKNKQQEYEFINTFISFLTIFFGTIYIIYNYISYWPGKSHDILDINNDNRVTCCYYKLVKNESCKVI